MIARVNQEDEGVVVLQVVAPQRAVRERTNKFTSHLAASRPNYASMLTLSFSLPLLSSISLGISMQKRLKNSNALKESAGKLLNQSFVMCAVIIEFLKFAAVSVNWQTHYFEKKKGGGEIFFFLDLRLNL